MADCPPRSKTPPTCASESSCSRDQHGHHAAQRFHAQRERSHVEQQDVFHFAAQHAALNRRADRDHFVRVDALMRFLAANRSLTICCTRGIRVEPPTSTTSSILSGVMPASESACLQRSHRALKDVFHQLFELRARQFQLQVLRARRVRRDEGQIDVRLLHLDNSILAFSAASFSRCSAMRSLLRSMP